MKIQIYKLLVNLKKYRQMVLSIELIKFKSVCKKHF